jgi:exodeoxyribonuclease VII large subunit
MPPVESIRLSQLAGLITKTIDDAFSNKFFWVIADVTNHNFHQNKWHFFDLVEKDTTSNKIVANLRTTAWKPGAEKIADFEHNTGQKFKNDISVLIKVSVEYSPEYGLGLIVHDISQEFTLGILEQQRQETLNRLLAECSDFIRKVGDKYITRNNLLHHRLAIQRLAIISSQNSAGYQDFKHTLEQNPYNYKFYIDNYFTLVQGENNADQVKQKFLDIFNSKINYDAVILIRGGGSQTDFLLFNTFIIGKIVAKFPIPVITGIGHQKNETIADLMAHSPTKTPTKAAEFIISHNMNFEAHLLEAQKTIVIKSQQIFSRYFQSLSDFNTKIVNNTRTLISFYKQELSNTNQSIINLTKTILFDKHRQIVNLSNQILSKPKIIISAHQNDLKNVISNFKVNINKYFINYRGYLGHHVSVIKLMNPKNLLEKGFAIITLKGVIMVDPAKIPLNSDIQILLSDTEITSTVKSKTKSDGTQLNF